MRIFSIDWKTGELLTDVQLAAILESKDKSGVRKKYIDFLESNFSGSLNPLEQFHVSTEEYNHAVQLIEDVRSEQSRQICPNEEILIEEDKVLAEEIKK